MLERIAASARLCSPHHLLFALPLPAESVVRSSRLVPNTERLHVARSRDDAVDMHANSTGRLRRLREDGATAKNHSSG